MLSEVAQTVDDVVVIADGRLVVHAPLGELTAGGGRRVRVESPDAVELAGALDAAGMDVVRRTGDELVVAGATREAIARLAMQAGLLVLGLSDEADSLEDVFLDLTTTTVAEVLA